MSTPNNLIVWIDATPDTDACVADAIARASDDDVLVLVASMDRPALVVLDAMQVDTDRLLRRLREDLATGWGARVTSAGRRYETHVGRGDGADVLADVARRHLPATIVISAASPVATKLVHHHARLPCPVVCIPTVQDARDEGLPVSARGSRRRAG